MTKFFNAKNLHSLPDGGLDEKGKRKQKLYTDEHHRSFKLLVTGNSRLFYSQWEKPKHMLKVSQKRQPKLTPLGSVEDFSYSAALAAHLKLQDDIKQGIYPEATKGVGRRKTGPTFETYGTKVVAGWADKRKNAKDAAGMKRIIPIYCTAINNLPIEKIGTPEVLDVMRPIWDAKPAMAEEVRALVARVLKAAAREELRPMGDPASVEAIVAVLGKPVKKRGRIRGPMKALKGEKMPEFMVELRAIKSQSARALEALILFNLRTNAVRYLHIDHLDLEGGADDPLRPGPKWTVPNDLMKVDDDGHPFILPMVPRLVAVLKEQIAYLQETFPGQPVGLLWPGDASQLKNPFEQPISENTMRDLLVDTLKKNATPHGMRATFQTWAENELQDDGETMKFNPDAIGYCMAHNPGDKVKRAYRRNRLWKPRMGIMNAWERHLARPRPQLKAVA